MKSANTESSGFARYAWIVLAYTILVILWGTYVRATGSGAGCGSHWPLCNGEVIPRAPDAATMIEYTHRITSGFALLLVVGLFYAFRLFPKGSPVRAGAVASTILIVIEALIGAGLVRFELVGDNASLARAISVGAHLVNTFLLLGAITLTAWWASGGKPFGWKNQGLLGIILILAFAGLSLLGATGAINALGDTLFPVGLAVEAMSEGLPPSSHFLIRLRVLHPSFALVIGAFLLLTAWYANKSRPSPGTRLLAHGLGLLVVIQLIAGSLNIAMMAPVWMQLVHLLLADLLWINLVLLAAVTLSLTDHERERASLSGRELVGVAHR